MASTTKSERMAGAAAADAQDSLELVYRAQAASLRRRVLAQVGSAEEANDLVHEAFARLVGARSATPLRNPGAFLGRIVRNLLIDRSRRLKTRPVHLPLDAELEIAVAPDQADAIELEQMRNRYRAIVASLPPRMGQVFVLHRIEGLSYREIAQQLDISVRTVEWHLAEAIVRIGRGLDNP